MLYPGDVKTAISLPDATARRIDRVAGRHGMSRSEFYRRAAERFADELDGADLTAEIDAAIEAVGQPGDDTAALRARANARLVRAAGESW